MSAIEGFTDLIELNRWAARNNMGEHPAVKLQRIHILSEAVVNNQENKMVGVEEAGQYNSTDKNVQQLCVLAHAIVKQNKGASKREASETAYPPSKRKKQQALGTSVGWRNSCGQKGCTLQGESFSHQCPVVVGERTTSHDQSTSSQYRSNFTDGTTADQHHGLTSDNTATQSDGCNDCQEKTHSLNGEAFGATCTMVDSERRTSRSQPIASTSTCDEGGSHDEPKFTFRTTLDRHHSLSSDKTGRCNWCGHNVALLPAKPFCSACSKLGVECTTCHRPLPSHLFTNDHKKCNSCFKKQSGRGPPSQHSIGGTLSVHEIVSTPNTSHDILQFFNDNQSDIQDIISRAVTEDKAIKWYLTLQVRLVKTNDVGEQIFSEPVFRSRVFISADSGEIVKSLAEAMFKIFSSFQEFEGVGSGWILEKVQKAELNIAKYAPFQGSMYIPTPSKLVRKKAILNIINDDNLCFAYCVLAALHPAPNNANRLTHYRAFLHELCLEGIDLPVPINQISKFEVLNGISVNVFGYERMVFPIHITEHRYSKHVNLLLISNDEKRHYCLINSMSRLLSGITKSHVPSHVCNYCLHRFTSQQRLQAHIPVCSPNGPQRIRLPHKPDEKWLKFININKQLRVPFLIVCDFECFTRKIQDKFGDGVKYERHDPSGFCYLVICTYSKYSKPAVIYRGANVVETFITRLLEEKRRICKILDKVEPMVITSDEQSSFESAKNCCICDKELSRDRVRHHDHLSGRYVGATHNVCNLQLKFKRSSYKEKRDFFIPVVFHGLKNYDSHLIIEVMGKFKNLKISCIPNNMQKYISFTLGNLRFIDSYQFLSASLETLVSNMVDGGTDKFHQLKKHFPDTSHHYLLFRKQVYPYSHICSNETFEETQLPSKDGFYNDLKEESISDEDYDHAKKVWSAFDIKNMGGYHDFYLKLDVLLLADVFENFRDFFNNHYRLDPPHYYTLPGLCWDAMLRMTGACIELLDDLDMYLMIERGIRGGISMITRKYSKANNHYLNDFDPSLPSKYILYLDCCNLYGKAMLEPLPLRDFAWMTDEELATIDVLNIPIEAETGYILECDIDYPSSIHTKHNDFPLAPEKLKVTDDMLSPHSLKLKEHLVLKGKGADKLIPNLCNKFKYVLHYRNLQFYCQQGMILKKIHRGIRFTQTRWLQPYIEFTTEKRKMAANEFERNLCKFFVNSIYGKTLESVRKRTNIDLVNNQTDLLRNVAKPSFESFRIFNEDLAGVQRKTVNLFLNKPVFAGFAVLDISKLIMFDFYYNQLKRIYGQKLNVLFSDTDSICASIETDDVYDDMSRHISLYDTSNYPSDHRLYTTVNAKIPGKMKDECGGVLVKEFVGLRAKTYSLQTVEDEKKTAKGVSKYAIRKKLKHEMYRDCLFNQHVIATTSNQIRSIDHVLFSVCSAKKGLNPFDDKRYVLDDSVTTLAYGHCDITDDNKVSHNNTADINMN